MTKEELIEMIDATITENGNKEITGKALNLALTEIVNAMCTGGGQSQKRVYVEIDSGTPLTDEEKASNAELFAEISGALTNGTPPPLYVQISIEGTYVVMNCLAIQYASTVGMIIMFIEGQFRLSPDGNCVHMQSSSALNINGK